VALGTFLGLSAGLAAPSASAAECSGHPDAIETSRTLVVDPREHPRLGAMQYPETLPLRDHEVVLTFDDGPLPRNSNQILQILADNCIQAIFFTIGEQAAANPEGVRKLAAAGHTIGTHSQHHPLTFAKMPFEKARQEIDDGIASVSAPLSDPNMVAPFFRFPGLLRAESSEEYLASKGIQVWSADFLADDWRHISSARVYELAIQRIEARHRGILLLHDIQARTVAALPKILRELKARGYRIVHVVPATPDRPATPTEPQDWLLRPPSENVPIAHWPRVPNFVFADAGSMVAPALSDFDTPDGELLLSSEPFDRAKRLAHGVPLPREAPWPRQMTLPPQDAAVALPVPAASLFELPENVRVAFRSLPSETHRAEATPPAREVSLRRLATGGPHGRRGGREVRESRHVAPGGRAAMHQVREGSTPRRPVRVASLKKR
jgi:peptidoglycan/xylan/chitin deacetylase (PgdA/CDA1 family)